MRTLWRILKRALLVLVSLLAILVAMLALWLWLGHPKRPVDSVFVRPAGEGVFKFTDIPKGRVLTSPEVDGYARKLMAGMSLQEKVLQMSGDTSVWDLVKLVTVEKGKYNDHPIPAGANRRLAIPPHRLLRRAAGRGSEPLHLLPGRHGPRRLLGPRAGAAGRGRGGPGDPRSGRQPLRRHLHQPAASSVVGPGAGDLR